MDQYISAAHLYSTLPSSDRLMRLGVELLVNGDGEKTPLSGGDIMLSVSWGSVSRLRHVKLRLSKHRVPDF